MMIGMVGKTTWVSMASIALTGCATVNPREDYERAGRQIRGATGHERIYDPQEDDLVADTVVRLYQDGLTSSEAVEVCLFNNPTLQAAFMDVGMARADVVQAGLLSNPFVGFSAKLPDGGGLANLEAGVAQNIAQLWQIPLRERAAERTLSRVILELARLAVTLATDAKSAYYAAVGADELHKMAQENLVLAEDFLRLAQARQEAGATSELDVNLSRSLVLNADIDVERTRLASADARRKLATLLGLVSQADELELVEALPDTYPTMADGSSLVALAKGGRLDLRAARESVGLAQARLDEQYRLVFPVVDLGLEFEREDRRSQGGRDILADTARATIANGGLTAPDIKSRSQRRGERGQDTIIGPSLGIEIPIFDQNHAQIAKAEYALRQAQKTLCAVDRSVTQEVRTAVDRTLTAWRLMQKFRDLSIPLAHRNLELARESYRAGRAPFLTVLEAQRFFLETRCGLVRAAQVAAQAIPELEKTIGLPFTSLLADVNAEPASGDQAQEGVEP